MKTVVRVLIGLLLLVVVLVVIGFFLPSTVKVERSKLLSCTPEMVYYQIADLHNWDEWSPWHSIDTGMQVEFFGPAIGEGANYEWKSDHKSVGNGKLTITKAVPFDTVYTEMDFMEQGTADAYYIIEATDSGTLLTWGFTSDMGNNPIGKYFGLMMDSWIGSDYEKGLENLENICLNPPKYSVMIENLPTINYLGLRRQATYEEFDTEMGKAFTELMIVLENSRASVTGKPFAVYYSFGDQVDFEVGIPVSDVVDTKGDVVYNIMPANQYAAIDYYGPYSNLEEGHNAIQDWINERSLMTTGSPIEVYETDMMTEPDSTKWLTKIYYPFN